MHTKDVRVAGGTADIETGQLLFIKRSVCPITFCNYKFSISTISTAELSFIHPYVTNHNQSTHSPQSQWTLHHTVQSAVCAILYSVITNISNWGNDDTRSEVVRRGKSVSVSVSIIV